MLLGMDERPRYWFPAKRFGWGWGPPRVWQGWAVVAAFAGAVLVPVELFPDQPAVGMTALVGATVALLWVCARKGEPPRWRWGKR